ncbi:MAG: hypothetical protein ACE5GO_10565, partial [Anaerolineales bacterium]
VPECTGITTWGSHDGASWINGKWGDMDPLMFWDASEMVYDENAAPKCSAPVLAVSGQVLDAQNNAPISGVQVDLLGEYNTRSGVQTTVLGTTYTDDNGDYQLVMASSPTLPPGGRSWWRVIVVESPPPGNFPVSALAPVPPASIIDDTTIAYAWPASGAVLTQNNYTLTRNAPPTPTPTPAPTNTPTRTPTHTSTPTNTPTPTSTSTPTPTNTPAAAAANGVSVRI